MNQCTWHTPATSPAPLPCQLSMARTRSLPSAIRCSWSQPFGYCERSHYSIYTASLVSQRFLDEHTLLQPLLRPCFVARHLLPSRDASCLHHLPLPSTIALTRKLCLGRKRLCAGLHAPHSPVWHAACARSLTPCSCLLDSSSASCTQFTLVPCHSSQSPCSMSPFLAYFRALRPGESWHRLGACAAILVATTPMAWPFEASRASDILENPVRPVIAFLLSLQGLHDFTLTW